eukprot:CAMPEP_0118961688 /NCGR_PEP_ID=MMETSP1173-20130426/293_1 /TAXON_ID=1034831 /ORGANISM="Rhizochromulina marina cf, Strain CCMP1243" /LENGTH=133 /DNA_ID=CAMNT_0006909873 /DNA_START=25 /DNA_END=426 /DNA_ORIENTATION=+
MGYTRFVEVGRVCLVNYGPDSGRLCVIVDIVDANKALVEGPRSVTGVARQIIPFKRLSLTDLKCDIQKGARDQEVAAALEGADIIAKWESTSWAKKLAAKKKRSNLSDFDRFKVMIARKQKSRIVAAKMAELR